MDYSWRAIDDAFLDNRLWVELISFRALGLGLGGLDGLLCRQFEDTDCIIVADSFPGPGWEWGNMEKRYARFYQSRQAMKDCPKIAFRALW